MVPPLSKYKGCVLCVMYLLYYTRFVLCFLLLVWKQFFLHLSLIRISYVFGRGAWVGEILSSASSAVGSESTEISRRNSIS